MSWFVALLWVCGVDGKQATAARLCLHGPLTAQHSTAAFLASSVTSLSLPNRPTHRGRAKPAHRASLGVGQFLDAMDGGWASARRAQVFQAKRRPDRGGEPGGGATSPSDPVLLALARSPSRSWAGPARIPKRDPLTSPPCQPSNRPTPPSLSPPSSVPFLPMPVPPPGGALSRAPRHTFASHGWGPPLNLAPCLDGHDRSASTSGWVHLEQAVAPARRSVAANLLFSPSPLSIIGYCTAHS